MVLSFTLIKLNGCKIRVTNIQNENYANTLSAIPPVCFDVLTNGGLSNTAVYNSDTAMLYNRTNTTVISKNFPFQGTIVGTSGYPLGGNQLWMLANSYSSNNALYIGLGFASAPTATANTSVAICQLDIEVDIDFAKAIKAF